jgi:hypothetical protein
MDNSLDQLLHTGTVVIENRETIFGRTILTIGGGPTCLLANAHSELGPFSFVNPKGINTIRRGQFNNLPNGTRVQIRERGIKPNTTVPQE